MKTPRPVPLFIAFAVLWFAAATAVSAAPAPPEVYRNALYLERGAGDLAAALATYDQVASAPAAAPDLAALARWRSGLCLELLGRRTEAAQRHLELLDAISDGASADLQEVRATAARTLLRMAEEDAAAGAAPARQAAEWMARVQVHFPQMSKQMAMERVAMRRVLQGGVDTWDGHRPVNASVRIRARSGTPGPVEALSTWRTQTDAEGSFSIELPIGRYDVRVWAPAYERIYAAVVLTPEEEAPLEIRRVLPRIRIPSEITRIDLVGSFLDKWDGAQPLIRGGDGIWEVRHRLGAGRHEYKFRINEGSHLVTDVAASAFVDDSHDNFNALIELDREQEIVFRFDERDPHFDRGLGENP